MTNNLHVIAAMNFQFKKKTKNNVYSTYLYNVELPWIFFLDYHCSLSPVCSKSFLDTTKTELNASFISTKLPLFLKVSFKFCESDALIRVMKITFQRQPK